MSTSLDLAMAMEHLRREADALLVKKQPFEIAVSYDGKYLITSLKELRTVPQEKEWTGRALAANNSSREKDNG